jgi:lipoprotein
MNRIFTLLIAVFSVFSIVSCDRSSDDNKPQEEQRIIEVPFTEELKGVYKIHYKDTPSGWEAVPAGKYKLEFREGNTVYWTDENGEHEEFFAHPENRYPYADRNKKGYLFSVWENEEYRGSQYLEVVMMIQDSNGIKSIFRYYCTKQR